MVNFGIVLQYYYAARWQNLVQITNTLHCVERNRHFIVDNAGDMLSCYGWRRIPMAENRVYNRCLIPFLYPEIEYWYVQDDDLIVTPKDVYKLIDASERNKGKFCGIEGRILGKEAGTRVSSGCHGNRYATYLNTHTDYVLRAYAFHRSAIVKGFERLLNLGEVTADEDILMTLDNAMVVPEVDWQNLDECGVGLFLRPDGKKRRDELVERIRGN